MLLDRAQFSRQLLDACQAMTRRGLRVDDALRRQRLALLTTHADTLQAEARPLIEALKDKLANKNLYWSYPVCRGCRNGKNKRLTCTQCHGVGKFEHFCLDENTQVLMADFSWRAIRDVRVGDKMLSMGPCGKRGKKAKWTVGEVTDRAESVKVCHEIRTEHGTLLASPDHTVLTDRSAKYGHQWATVGTLRVGTSKLRYVFEAKQELPRLGGLADGEGTLHRSRRGNNPHSGFSVVIAQNEGLVLDDIIRGLTQAGYVASIGKNRKRCKHARIIGGILEAMRFLSEAKPIRLIAKALEYIGEGFVGFLSESSRVQSISVVGKRKTVDLTLTTGNFIANGFVVHNSCNLGSPHQLKDILYGALRLPKRSSGGVVTTDEEALQSLVALDKSGLVMLALKYAKLSTMREIYERIAPAPDGHVRTVMNPAGTYTFRFSHKSAFYVEAATNLANLPNVEAKRDPLYAVRDCLIPEPGEVFLEADLSAADTWSVAALSDDAGLLDMLRTGADIHSFTAANMLGIPASAVTKPQRNIVGKVTRHAGSFGEGWNSLMRRINAMADLTGLTATAAQAKQWTRNFQALHPNLDAVWWNRVEQTLRDGRPMRAFTGQTCQFYPRLDDNGSPDAETVRAAVAWEPQYNTSILAKMALRDMFQQEDGSNWRVLLDSHDAILIGVPKARVHNAARALKKAMEREIVVNGHRVTIPAEVFRCSTRWSEKERLL